MEIHLEHPKSKFPNAWDYALLTSVGGALLRFSKNKSIDWCVIKLTGSLVPEITSLVDITFPLKTRLLYGSKSARVSGGKMVMKKSFLVLVFSIIVATGCSNETEKSGPILHEETIGDLAYEVKLSNNEFGMNEEIEVVTSVKNLGKEPLTYVSGSSSCPSHAVVRMIHQESTTELAINPGETCTADLVKSVLKPGEMVEDKQIFISKYYSKSELKPAYSGTYELRVSLPPEDVEITEDYQSKPINPRMGTKTQIILSDNH